MPRAGRPSLLWALFAVNALVLTAAFSILAFSPATISSPLSAEGFVSLAGLLIVLTVDFVLMRQAFTPLARLTRVMREVDPLRPGQRVPVYGRSAEVVELTEAFNEMLDRLETERRESGRRSLAAQETERRRVARELHDEIGQSLTALLLQLEHASRGGSPEVAGRLLEAQKTARASLTDVRGLASRLRPEALDDLGLASALVNLSERVSGSSSLKVERHIARDLPALSEDVELVIYRVAQEGLTNALRHSGASQVDLRLERRVSSVILRIADDGRGMAGEGEGAGITGMRERAILVGADLEIGRSVRGGVEICLEVSAATEPAE